MVRDLNFGHGIGYWKMLETQVWKRVLYRDLKEKKHKKGKEKKKLQRALYGKKSLFGSQILFLNQPKRLWKTIKMKCLKEKSKEKQGFQI